MPITRRTFTAGLMASPILGAQILNAGKAFALESGVLTIAQGFDPASLWPNFSTTQEEINIGNLIVESLFWTSPERTLQPILATGYELVDDKTAKIALRENIKFTNGEPLDADAVVHSVAVFTDVKQTPGYGRTSIIIDHAEKVDDKTVLLHLKQPYPALELVLGQIFVTPPKYWNEVGGSEGFGKKPVGTGPFKLNDWVRDSHIIMDANPDYWGDAPKGVKQLVMRPIPEDLARAAALLAGEVDIATNLPIAVLPQISAQGDLKVISVPGYRIFTIALSNRPKHTSPLQDVRVRQAVNYAVDKQAIINGLFSGQAKPLHGQVLRADQIGFDASIDDYAYDPAKAKALLAEAGYADGFEVDFRFPAGRYAQDKEVAEAISGMLAEVGIRTKMISLETGEFFRQMDDGELQPMGMFGLAPPDDPDMQVSQYRSDWRYSYVNNPDLDTLIDAGRQELDKEKRAEIYKKAMRLMHDQAHVLFLYQSVDQYGVSGRLKGFAPRGDQRWLMTGVSLE